MPPARVSNMVVQLLDQAQDAAAVGDWDTVALRAQTALRLSPGDEDAQMFADAARTRGLPAEAPKKKSAARWPLGIGVIVFAVLWFGGFFDVFMAEQGIPLRMYDCYGSVFNSIWCTGPLSTSPLPDWAYVDQNGIVRTR